MSICRSYCVMGEMTIDTDDRQKDHLDDEEQPTDFESIACGLINGNVSKSKRVLSIELL